MEQIASMLMSFGMGFEYENYCSLGEKITSLEMGLEVSTQNGEIYFSCASPTEVFEETEQNYALLASKVEQECINETT